MSGPQGPADRPVPIVRLAGEGDRVRVSITLTLAQMALTLALRRVADE